MGVEAYTFHKYTFFEAVDKTAALGLAYIGALSFQKVSDTIPKNFTPELTDDELREIRLKLDAAGLSEGTSLLSFSRVCSCNW